MRFWLPASLCVAMLGMPGFGQKADVLPLPLVSHRAIQPETIERLTASGKARLALKNTFGSRAIGNRFLLSGMHQWRPSGGMGRRDGRLWQKAGLAVGSNRFTQFIQLSADAAFKTDPRYDRRDLRGFSCQNRHALKRILADRREDGGEMISVSNFAAAYVPPMITDQWYPARLNTWVISSRAELSFSPGAASATW